MQEVEIRIKGKIDENWSNWFGGFAITYSPKNETTLRGIIRDQAQLRGVIGKLADLGLELVSVTTKPKGEYVNH